MDDNVIGAEADGGNNVAEKPLLEQMAEEQAAAEAEDGTEAIQQPAENESAPVEGGQPTEPAEAALEPLSPEEYQKRHRDLTAALKEERQAKREFRDKLAQLEARLSETRETQPIEFQKFTLDQRIAEYQQINWQLFAAQNPDGADAAAREFEALVNQREQIERHAQQTQVQRQQQAQQQQFTSFVETVNAQEAEYAQAKPDYQEAVNFLKSELIAEAETQGFFGDQAQRYATQRIVEVSQRVHASGKNVAEFGYKLALQNGYKPRAPDIASIKAGAEAAKSISTIGSKSTNEGGSFEETMSNLSGAAAKAYWEKAKKQSYG